MKPEEKDLLLKDLCGRLPYEPIVEYVLKAFGGGNATMTCTLDTIHLEDLLQDSEDLVHIKPYLRPMSSMTEEEREEYEKTLEIDYQDMLPEPIYHKTLDSYYYLLEHHFDFQGLIPAGCAIKVTEDNNPYKD